MTNTITISFLSELKGYFYSCRYINNDHEIQCMKVPDIADKRNVA